MGLAAAALLLAALQDDTYTLTLRYERMHCDECRLETEALLKRLPGAVSSTIGETSATVVVAEAATPAAPAGLPRDIGYKGAWIQVRGTAAAAGERLSFTAKGSGASLALAGPKLAELKAALGGKNRFRLSGRLEGKSLAVESFQAADW
jgi:copper chaperone CopZ